MKIGLLTYHCAPNFGAQLQTISTIGYIKKCGYTPIVINWYPKDLEEMYSNRVPACQIEVQRLFSETWMPLSPLCLTEADVVNEISRSGIDAIIVGSDALFKYVPINRRRYFDKRHLRFVSKKTITVDNIEGNPFFGGFLSGLDNRIPAYAFSVSSQNCPYFAMNKQERIRMRKSLGNYLNISVRDEWTKRMIDSVTEQSETQITPDPVFSFNSNNYIPLLSKTEILQKYNLEENYILLSFGNKYVDNDYVIDIASELEKQGYQAVLFPMPEGHLEIESIKRIDLPLNPIDWYALIKYSSGYIGERMHPIIVCLHNLTPFFSFDEYGINSVKWFGLKKNYMQNSSKTFCVLNDAGLTDWLFSYKMDEALPTPSKVLNRINQFDKEKCKSFANHCQIIYNRGMENIVSNINILKNGK